MKAQGRKPPSPGRLQDTSKGTKARQEKHGQHKLGQGGYGRLKARVGDLFNEKSTKQDLKVGFTQGFDGVVERRISLGKSPCVSMEDMESNNANNAPDVPNEPHPDPHIDSSVVAEGPLHSDADRERRSTSVETTMWPPAIVSTAPANPVDAHAHPEPPRQNTRSSSWHEVLSTDDATLQERPITVGDQLNADDDDLICAFVDNRKKKKKKKKNK